jgi:glycosyltransferase involved in cell wall biosynthesis
MVATGSVYARLPLKVSCLTVTWGVPGRFAFLRRSIAAYCAQTHRCRELVIVLHGGSADYRAAVAAHVAALGRDDVRIVEAAETLRLGELRNLSRDQARGDVHCQWDDDDLHHPERIERQLAALIGSGLQAVYCREVMQYFPAERVLYCTNWHATEANGHPGTLMCAAAAPVRYSEAEHGSEDMVLARQLKRLGVLHLLADAPYLYVYVSHGANVWNDAHHRMLVEKLAVSKRMLQLREAQIRQGLAVFDFGPGPVMVQGANGMAFTIP